MCRVRSLRQNLRKAFDVIAILLWHSGCNSIAWIGPAGEVIAASNPINPINTSRSGEYQQAEAKTVMHSYTIDLRYEDEYDSLRK